MTDLRAALASVIGPLSFAQGAAILRIAAALEGKGDPGGYWRSRGRSRFARELERDGLALDLVGIVLETVDEILAPDVDLGALLDDLRRRS